MKHIVSLEKCSSYDQKDVDAAVAACLDRLGGMKAFVKKGDKVLLKVNLLRGEVPQKVVTTHPSIVAAVIRLVKQAGGKPSVGDSPALASFESVARASGIAGVCAQEKVPCIELSGPEHVAIPAGRVIRSVSLSKKLREFDVIINMPKLKTHVLTGYTGAVKNLYGCIPGKVKASYHLRYQDGTAFTEMLLDLESAIRPKLSIMDGIIGMEGNGPGQGTPRNIGVVIASDSALATDLVATHIIGMGERQVPLLHLAKKLHLMTMDDITLKGASIEEVVVHGFKRPAKPFLARIPAWVQKPARGLMTQKPVVIPELCIACASCEGVCPAKAIMMRDKLPRFDYGKCIRCYCCAEVCPKKAIELQSGLLARLVQKLLK